MMQSSFTERLTATPKMDYASLKSEFIMPLTDDRKLVSHRDASIAKNLRWGSENPYFRFKSDVY